MKFLIQKGQHYDFSNKLIENKENYDGWNLSYDIDYASFDELSALNVDKYQSHIPVGSVEFVNEFVRVILNAEHIKPINVPESLRNTIYTGRPVINMLTEEDVDYFKKYYGGIGKLYSTWYVKDLNKIKSEDNKFYLIQKDHYFTCECRIGPDGKGVSKICVDDLNNRFVGKQVSLMLDDIVSEWRIFVTKNYGGGYDVMGCENYKGDVLMFPKRERIFEFIDAYEDKPDVFTLDVMVDKNGNTWVLEVHDFFSCGLYGFEDYKYPWMLQKAWFDIKNKLVIK